jgi:hypothetical protein
MGDYKFFYNFFINDKLVTAVLCFGSHICNQAIRITVKTSRGVLFKFEFLYLDLLLDTLHMLPKKQDKVKQNLILYLSFSCLFHYFSLVLVAGTLCDLLVQLLLTSLQLKLFLPLLASISSYCLCSC